MTVYMPQNYKEAVAYIEDLPRFTKKHTLEHTRKFLRRLGNPGEDRRIIHVAGTNGKGSVCAYIQAVLEAEGKKTGFFTSPHLVKINERIQIGRKPVSDASFYKVFTEVFPEAVRLEEEGDGHPSYFEFLFGMGMKEFAHSDAGYLILETGLGGRLDATNAPENPFLTVITSVSMDHTDILGDTIEKIAYEKAGIIKCGVPVFYDGSDGRVSAVIRAAAEERKAPCREISNHAFEILEVAEDHIAFCRKSAYDKDITWQVPICGLYQVMNAELALQAVEYLLREEKECHIDRWRQAVASVRWEGRMEKVSGHLTIDGAHNPGALCAFAESVMRLHPEYGGGKEEQNPVLVFSAVSDKKYEQMIQILCESVPAKAYIITEIEDERGVPAEKLGELFRQYTQKPVYVRKTTGEALETADEVRGDSEIYCLGSLYLAGQVKKYLSGGNGNVGF